MPKNCQTTIGVEFITTYVPLQSGGWVKLQVWDTAGQEKYKSICEAHYKGCHGAFIVYDVTNLGTFQNAAKWLEEIRRQTQEGLVVILVGNKCDLTERRKVSTEDGREFAEKEHLLFIETSALEGFNVNRMFEDMAQNI